MNKTTFAGITLGIMVTALIGAGAGLTYVQGSSSMQIFVSPQDENRNDDDPKDKVREIIDKVKDIDNSEEEEDARDIIEKIKDKDNGVGIDCPSWVPWC